MTSVLIVEDQRMPRENMEHLVEDSGRYRRVASLSTAEMALAQCARHTVELVLMDVCTKGSRDGIDGDQGPVSGDQSHHHHLHGGGKLPETGKGRRGRELLV